MSRRLHEKLSQSINIQIKNWDSELYDILSDGSSQPIKTGQRLAKPLITAMKGRLSGPFINQIDYPEEYRQRVFDVLVYGEFIKEAK